MNDRYKVSLTTTQDFYVTELLELAQLINRRYPKTLMEIPPEKCTFILTMYSQDLSLYENDLSLDTWGPSDTDFFDALIKLDLATKWVIIHKPQGN